MTTGAPKAPPPGESAPEDRPEDGIAQVRARQQERAKVMALVLGALVLLVYAIALVKMEGAA